MGLCSVALDNGTSGRQWLLHLWEECWEGARHCWGATGLRATPHVSVGEWEAEAAAAFMVVTKVFLLQLSVCFNPRLLNAGLEILARGSRETPLVHQWNQEWAQ